MSQNKLDDMSVNSGNESLADSVQVIPDASYQPLIESEAESKDSNQEEAPGNSSGETSVDGDKPVEEDSLSNENKTQDPEKPPVESQAELVAVNETETDSGNEADNEKDEGENDKSPEESGNDEVTPEKEEAVPVKTFPSPKAVGSGEDGIDLDKRPPSPSATTNTTINSKMNDTDEEEIKVPTPKPELEREDSLFNSQIIKIDKNINKKYRYIKYKSIDLMKNMMISKKNFMNLLIEIMEMIDAEEELSGKEKSAYVINLCKYLVFKYNIFYQDEADILFKLLPDAINIICLVSKKKMHVVKNTNNEIRKKKELSVITYTIYEKIQEYMVEHKFTVDTLEKRAPTIIMELIKYSYDYAYLRSDEKKNVAIKVSQLILTNLQKLFESASVLDRKRLQIVFDCLESFIDVILNIEKGKYYINVNPSNGVFTINRSQPVVLPKKKKPFWVCCS